MPEEHDPVTGEIIEGRAADGSRLPPPAATIADTLRLLADGQFDADASAELRELIRKMEEHAFNQRGGVVKGQLTITLDIALANGAHVVTPSFKVKAPVPKQPGTLLFAFEDGRLSRNPPGQGALFGLHAVDGPRDVVTV